MASPDQQAEMIQAIVDHVKRQEEPETVNEHQEEPEKPAKWVRVKRPTVRKKGDGFDLLWPSGNTGESRIWFGTFAELALHVEQCQSAVDLFEE